MVAHIHTVDGITVIVRGKPYSIANTNKAYDDVVAAVNEGEDEFTIEEIITRNARMVEEAVNLTDGMKYVGGVVMYLGRELHGYAVDKLVELLHGGHETRPLALFLAKLQNNPSKQTVDNLYQFLEFGRIPITKDGNFLAYKAIRSDWKDIHSGTMDNSIGTVVRMDRKAVDDRRDVTCSNGLHVCSFSYLPHFASADGHVVVCEINPADVVAIPNDYNNTKMRVSQYRVVGEVENYYREHRDILTEQSVWEPKYVVFARDEDTDEWQEIADSDDVEKAVGIADTELIEWSEVKVMDTDSIVVYRKRRD